MRQRVSLGVFASFLVMAIGCGESSNGGSKQARSGAGNEDDGGAAGVAENSSAGTTSGDGGKTSTTSVGGEDTGGRTESEGGFVGFGGQTSFGGVEGPAGMPGVGGLVTGVGGDIGVGGQTTSGCIGVELQDEGEPCSSPGIMCSECAADFDPCLPCVGVVCRNGIWTRMESMPPSDCGQGGSGGSAGQDSGGAAGADMELGGSAGTGGEDACATYEDALAAGVPIADLCAMIGMECPFDLASHIASSDLEDTRYIFWDGCEDTVTVARALHPNNPPSTFTFDRTDGALVGVELVDDVPRGPCREPAYSIGTEACSAGPSCTLAEAATSSEPACPVTPEACGFGDQLPAGYTACTESEQATLTGEDCTITITFTYSVGGALEPPVEYAQCVDARGTCMQGDPTPEDPLAHASCRLTYYADACPTPSSSAAACLKIP